MKRMRYMEQFKEQKPTYSQACDRLMVRVLELLGGQEETTVEDNEYW